MNAEQVARRTYQARQRRRPDQWKVFLANAEKAKKQLFMTDLTYVVNSLSYQAWHREEVLHQGKMWRARKLAKIAAARRARIAVKAALALKTARPVAESTIDVAMEPASTGALEPCSAGLGPCFDLCDMVRFVDCTFVLFSVCYSWLFVQDGVAYLFRGGQRYCIDTLIRPLERPVHAKDVTNWLWG